MASNDQTKEPKTKDVQLLKRHTHEGREYEPGAELRGMNAKSADWLIAMKVAAELPPAASK